MRQHRQFLRGTRASAPFLLVYPIFLFQAIVMFPPHIAAQQRADRLFVNGVIHTMDEDGGIGDAMAVAGTTVLAVGQASDLAAAFGSAERIDLGGRHVFPGFIDAHGHLHGLGEESMILALRDTRSAAEVCERVAGRAGTLPAGRWIRGRGWDQNDWTSRTLPSRAELDAVAPTHPVFLSRVDGHAAWVNTAALSLAGITSTTPDPPGGKIHRNADGMPTGILIDNAVELVRAIIPPPSAEEIAEAYRIAVRRCARAGMTGMHDMGLNREQIAVLESLIARGSFPFRLVGYVDGRGDLWEDVLRTGPRIVGEHQLVFAGLKLYADGALGSRGALLKAPYSDDPGNRGIQITERDTIREEARRALSRGMQVCVHAIGDGGNALALDAYGDALASFPADARAGMPRLRVEHAQVLDRADIPRFASLGVIASMQPTHCTSDMEWAESRVGPVRIRGAYAWASLLSAGAWLAGGSDTPVERPDPLFGIYSACTRRDHAGRPASQEDIDERFTLARDAKPDGARWTHGWYASEALGRMDAIRMFTSWAARAAGLERRLGSLRPGAYADFIILSRDIASCPDAELLQTSVLETWIGGTRVHPE